MTTNALDVDNDNRIIIVHNDNKTSACFVMNKYNNNSIKLFLEYKELYAKKNIELKVLNCVKEYQYDDLKQKIVIYENDYGVFSRPSMDYVWMSLARTISDRSTCLRSKVG